MKNLISKVFGWILIALGSSLLLYAMYCLLGEINTPTADRFGLVFVIGCGPIGSTLLGIGIILLIKQKTRKKIIQIIIAIVIAILFFFGITKLEEGRNIKFTALLQNQQQKIRYYI